MPLDANVVISKKLDSISARVLEESAVMRQSLETVVTCLISNDIEDE